MNKYSYLINFSEVKFIQSDLSQEKFDEFFYKFVFPKEEEPAEAKVKSNVISNVEMELFPKIQDRVNVNFVLRPNDFEELITPVEVNFIGKNGVIVAGQTFDFEKRIYNLENDIIKFISFSKAVDFEEFKKSKKGKYFVVGAEPDKGNLPQNHAIWKSVKESHMVNYIYISELET